jgi:hypothetical protein
MSEHGPRTGAARDVPPPRPVEPAPLPPEAGPESAGLARAARALADAVTGLLGSDRQRTGPDDRAGSRRTPAAGLAEVLGALTGVLGSALGRRRTDDAGAGPAEAEGRPRGGPGALLGDLLATAAPRLPIRDAATLRQAHPGASDEEIADALVARAARITSGIGAAAGGVSAAHWFAPGSLVMVPIELGAETVLTAGVEVALLGELHELYGRPAPGDARARASAYLASWSAQRAVDGTADGVAGGVGSLLGAAGMRALSRRVTRRMARSIPSAAPFLVGAALGGRSNRRSTENLAGRVRDDLRRRD